MLGVAVLPLPLLGPPLEGGLCDNSLHGANVLPGRSPLTRLPHKMLHLGADVLPELGQDSHTAKYYGCVAQLLKIKRLKTLSAREFKLGSTDQLDSSIQSRTSPCLECLP